MRQSAELPAAIDKAGLGNAVKAEDKVRAKGCFGGFKRFLARRATIPRPFQTLLGSFRSAVQYTPPSEDWQLVGKAGQSLNFLF